MPRVDAAQLPAARCPHCSIANPSLIRIWWSQQPTGRATPGPLHFWGIFGCTSCGGVVLARSFPNGNPEVETTFPPRREVHTDIPEPARRFLSQAIDTLHAPDAAAVMAGSAVDAMLKHLGYPNDSLYSRIDQAVTDHKLTKAMGDWAHEVRLGSNRPRHADAEQPHVSAQEAAQSVEFAEALGQFLFVLTARIDRGKAAAIEASKSPA
jgi:uncharacterized protein DUF4145